MESLGTAEPVLRGVAALAEGPRWDARTQRLLWVDIDGRALHEFDPAAGTDRAIGLPAKVGAAAPTADEDRVLVALADRLAMVDLTTGEHQPLVEFPHAREGMRANDGAVDSEERDHLMPERGTLSIGKARQVIGYQPEYPLERAVPQYVEWYQRLVANRPELLAN